MMVRSDQSRVEKPEMDASWLRRFRQRLRNWYRKHAREMPWRSDPDPYRVWISEIMLQQTQVATVIPYFERFLERFPDLQVLAAADEQEVLRWWEGLGYYRRARQLHRAAVQIVEEHQGVFPQEQAALLALPGIGRYTAGAILSIAFEQREPILEANTIRLLSRLLLLRESPASSASQQRLWQLAELLLPRVQVGTFNQALMELGSLVCVPQDPDCQSCPVRELCPTYEHALQDVIPATVKKPAVTAIREAAVMVQDQSRVLLRCCPPGERWAGLWDFPRFEVQHQRGKVLVRELEENVYQLTGIRISNPQRLQVIKHSVTRYRITLACYGSQWDPALNDQENLADHVQWVPIQDLENYPLSVTGRKMCHWLPLP
jgi:A/G-specific adenine glycosylase